MTKLDTLLASLPDAPFRQQLTGEIESLRQDSISLLHLLAQIREACGDNGKRMQGELVTYIRDERQGHISHIALLTATLKAEREEVKWMREALLTACDHINMSALRVSHCKDAAKIEVALLEKS